MRLSMTCAGLLLAALFAGPAPAATHVVTQSGLGFIPADLTVAAGDTVTWQWTAGSHTVTNGAGLADPALGTLFDAPLTSAAPTFTHVFADVGVVPYLCRPHAGLGMVGSVTVEAVSAVGDVPVLAAAALRPNVPNPFNPTTAIAFDLPTASPVRLAIHDVAGRLVRTLVDDVHLDAGTHRRTWDGRDTSGRLVAAGVYLSVLEAGGTRQVRTMALVK